MKKVLYLLIVILSISCSKNEEPPIEEVVCESCEETEELLKEYKIENMFADLSNFHFQTVNDSTVFFSGRLKDSQKFGFIGFNSDTKEKLFDLITFEYTSITKDLAYGEKVQFDVSRIIVFGYTENSSKSKVLFLGVSDGTISNSVGYIYFINNNKVSKIINPSIDNANNSNPEIIVWNQNFLIGSKYLDIVTLYSPSGEVIIKGLSVIFIFEVYSFDPLNDFEAIIINNSSHSTLPCYISKLNLREDGYIWSNELDLSKLDRPQITDKKLISKTDTHFTYEISYTEYSGNKGVIKFKVNIETGEIEYL